MADLTYGDLTNLTYGELAAKTYALESSGGGETSCVWTAEKVSEIMAELDSLTTEAAALKTQITALSTALSTAVSTLKSYGDTNWRTATGFATPADVQLTTTTETVEVVSQQVDLTELKTYGDARWSTATGFATPEDVQLTTTTETVAVVSQHVDLTELKAYGDARWATATGFATPEDVQLTTTTETVEVVSQTVDLAELKTYGDTNWKTAAGFATAADLTTIAGGRTLADLATPEDVQLTTTTEMVEVVSQTVDLTELKAHGDERWSTATGFATPEDVKLTTTTETVEVVSQTVDLTELKSYGDEHWTTAVVPSADDTANAVWCYTWGGGLLARTYLYEGYFAASELRREWQNAGATTDTVASAVSEIKTHGDAVWKTAAGFATPSDVTLTTTTEVVEVVTQDVNLGQILSHGDEHWKTASGFATPSDVTTAVINNSSTALTEAVDLLTAVVCNWAVDGSRLIAYTADGSEAFTLTKDAAGSVIACRPE